MREVKAWDVLVAHLSSLEWVSYLRGPPAGSNGPNDLVRYRTRYLTGGPISNSRIVAADEHEVIFLAREGTKRGGELRQFHLFRVIKFRGDSNCRRWWGGSRRAEPSVDNFGHEFLSPVSIGEQSDPVGSCRRESGKRCSDKGVLAMPIEDYLERLVWTG